MAKPSKNASKKSGKDTDEGSAGFGGPLFLGLLSLLLGAVLSFGHLARTDAIQYNEKTARLQAERAAKGEGRETPPRGPDIPVYYVGSDTGGQAWQAKREAILSGEPGEIRVSEGELNAWARRSFNLASLKGEGGGLISITPGTPNFHLREDQLHLSMPVTVSAFGLNGNYRLIARGGFSVSGGKMAYEADNLFLSAAKVPPLGPLRNMILKGASAAFTVSDEYAELSSAWTDVSDVRVQGDVLVLSVN
ncbi:MAG: hypothetical protein ACFE0O_08620 [Opitutales bacterium]